MGKKILGYESMDGKKFVLKEDALDYAKKQCGVAFADHTAPEFEEFKQMFEEWYYSNWYEVEV